eukprot:SM000059S18663  [mRNA]  locus=s59:214869:220827:- [translate_table: standard]
MAEQGLASTFPLHDVAVMGLAELVPHLSRLRVHPLPPSAVTTQSMATTGELPSVSTAVAACSLALLRRLLHCSSSTQLRCPTPTLVRDGASCRSLSRGSRMLVAQARVRQAAAAAQLFAPDVVVTIDAKGFSFSVLRLLRAAPAAPQALHVQYVAPSYWAWKGGYRSLQALRGLVDHILCILPWEPAACRAHGIGATFVGHPAVEDVWPPDDSGPEHLEASLSSKRSLAELRVWGDRSNFQQQHGLAAASGPIVCVLPGSRRQEVARMLPIFRAALDKLAASQQCQPSLVFPLVPDAAVVEMVASAVTNWKFPSVVLPVGHGSSEKYHAFAVSPCAPCVFSEACDVALCVSGTVLMQLLLARLPAVVAYRAHPLTELAASWRAKVSYISLPNIILNRPAIAEAAFGRCTPTVLCSLLRGLIEQEEQRALQAGAAVQVLQQLVSHKSGGSSAAGAMIRPSVAAAEAILKFHRGLVEQQVGHLGSPSNDTRPLRQPCKPAGAVAVAFLKPANLKAALLVGSGRQAMRKRSGESDASQASRYKQQRNGEAAVGGSRSRHGPAGGLKRREDHQRAAEGASAIPGGGRDGEGRASTCVPCRQ